MQQGINPSGTKRILECWDEKTLTEFMMDEKIVRIWKTLNSVIGSRLRNQRKKLRANLRSPEEERDQQRRVAKLINNRVTHARSVSIGNTAWVPIEFLRWGTRSRAEVGGRWRGDQEWDHNGRFGSSARMTASILKGSGKILKFIEYLGVQLSFQETNRIRNSRKRDSGEVCP